MNYYSVSLIYFPYFCETLYTINMDSLKREIKIHNLLKDKSRIRFESEHKVCYGIYDDMGLECMNIIDAITVESLDKIVFDRRNYSLRARYNSHRNTEFFIVWLCKNSIHLLDKMFEKKDYTSAKSLILQHGYKC